MKLSFRDGKCYPDLSEYGSDLLEKYAAMCQRVMGEAGAQGWLETMRPMCPQMARVFIKPTWVGILDFEGRFPSAIERAMQRLQGGG